MAAWFRVTGWFERLAADLPAGVRTGQTNPQLTGAGGGHDISPHTLTRDGVRLIGRLRGISAGKVFFGDDLPANIEWSDAEARMYLAAIDRAIEAQGLDAPADELPGDLLTGGPAGDAAVAAPVELDLKKAAIRTVIWATGYRPDFGWVGLPFLDTDGYPIHRRGVTSMKGLYVLGLDWLHNAKSGLFAGITDDSSYLASVITARS